MSARRNVDIAATKIRTPVTLTISARRGNLLPRAEGRSVVLRITFLIAAQALVSAFVPCVPVRATRLTSGGSRQAFLQFGLGADLVRFGLC